MIPSTPMNRLSRPTRIALSEISTNAKPRASWPASAPPAAILSAPVSTMCLAAWFVWAACARWEKSEALPAIRMLEATCPARKITGPPIAQYRATGGSSGRRNLVAS